MNYIERIRSIVNSMDDKDFVIVNKIISIKNKKPFIIRPNSNFNYDMKLKFGIPVNSSNKAIDGIEIDDFHRFEKIILDFQKSFKAKDYLKTPDSSKHKICISLPENEEHLNQMISLAEDTSYKFLNPQFLSKNPMRGGYHARTNITITFGNTYLVQIMVKFMRDERTKETLDRVKKEFKDRLKEINNIIEYVGGYYSSTHKIANKFKIEEYINGLKNVIDNCNIDDIINGDANYISNMFGKLAFRSSLTINLYYKEEQDLLHFIFIKDNPNINFTQTLIFRPLKGS